MKKFFPITIGTNKHGLEFVHNEFKDYENYLIFAENLLKNDIPFMTGIAKGFLPSPGYAQDKNISGHAVIIYKNEGDIFYILDPDGGIQRNKQNNFKEIEKYVSYKMNKKDLQAGLEARPAKKFTIGYLKEIEKGKVSVSNIFNKSKKAIEIYSHILEESAEKLIKNNDTVNYNDFYDFIIKLIKPFALDLKNALKTIKNPSKIEKLLTEKLQEYQIFTLDFQKKLKYNEDLKATEFFIELSKRAKVIQQYLLENLDDEMRKETAPLPNSIGYDLILRQIKKVSNNQISLNDKLENICRLLYDAVSYYDWVGFYLVDKSKRDELILGPFVGMPTEHVRIAFGEGVCGQVAEQKKTMTVQDISREKNYLSCNINVRAEIVVPIFKNIEMVGEIDIDSHSVSPFTNDDKIFIEKVAKIVSEIF